MEKRDKEMPYEVIILNAKRLKYIREALAENNGIIKLKFKGFKEFKETNLHHTCCKIVYNRHLK